MKAIIDRVKTYEKKEYFLSKKFLNTKPWIQSIVRVSPLFKAQKMPVVTPKVITTIIENIRALLSEKNLFITSPK